MSLGTLKRQLRKGLISSSRLLPRSKYQRVALMPVLHVERLHLDQPFRNVLSFCEGYVALAGKKPLMTVITPNSPYLRRQLDEAGVSEDRYAGFITRLGQVADIGLHGHYIRNPEGDPCHHYWSERAVVIEQIRQDWRWLEDRGFLTARAYSGGWWYLNDDVVEALVQVGANYDFTLCATEFNQSPISRRMLREKQRPGKLVDIRPALAGVWALTSVPTDSVSAGALQFLRAALGNHEQSYFSLYGHDWDIRPQGAIEGLRMWSRRGLRFFDCTDLESLH